MKLFSNPASPFARKALVCAHEKGLLDDLDVVDVILSPVSISEDVVASNPVGKIPTLVLDDGTALYDSRVICEYLDGVRGDATLFPSEPDARFVALRRQAIGDGIMDATVGARYEVMLRPKSHQWEEWIDNQKAKYRRSLDALEAEALDLGLEPDIGTIAAACALGYLDLRYADEGWRDSRPTLAGWFAEFGERASMRDTRVDQTA